MCEKCETLVKCPAGEKRVQFIRRYVEAGGHANTVMVVDKSPNGNVDAYITTEIQVGNSYSNIPIDITHCPFCGEDLGVTK